MRKEIGMALMMLLISPAVYGQTNSNGYQIIERLVRQRNDMGLKQFYQLYHTLDYTDNFGQTPLCRAIVRRDYFGYRMLVKNGASRKHSCVQNMSYQQKKEFDIGYKSYLGMMTVPAKSGVETTVFDASKLAWGTAGLLGIGGVVALAAGGGGGGGGNDSGSSGKNEDNTTNNGSNSDSSNNSNNGSDTGYNDSETNTDSENNSGGETDNSDNNSGSSSDDNGSATNPEIKPDNKLTATDFETTEYKKGNFLQQVNASSAYARFYSGTKNAAGTITELSSHLNPVTVGVIDVGVYNSRELSKNLLSGYNFDYGPCTSKNTKNCWKYVDGWFSSGFAFVDSSGQTGSVQIICDKSTYNDWANQYKADYAGISDSSTAPSLTTSTGVHGTHVAGIIAAEKNSSGMHGIAPNAKIVPVKYDLVSGVTNPINALLNDKNNVRVINMSLGTPSDSTYNASAAQNNKSYYAGWLSGDLVGYETLAKKQSTVLVVAAGNERQSGATQPSLEAGAGLYYPDLQKVMLVVVSVDKNNQLSSFSNPCGVTSGYCLAAPGENVISTIDSATGMASLSGTSMATPVVSGAVAFLMGAYPNLSAADVTSLVLETATDLGIQGVDSTYGHGLLNLDAATKPVGEKTIAVSNNVSGERVNLKEMRLTVPVAMQTLLRQMPQQTAILDKYERAFLIPTGQIVQVSNRDGKIFQNQLHRFMKFDTVKRVEDENNPLSFGFSSATKKDSALGLGAMDITYQFDKNKVRFYFMEDSTYGSGEFFDKTTMNPFTAMGNAYGVDNTYQLNKKTEMSFGFMTGQNALFKTNEDDIEDANRLTSFHGSITYNPFEKLSLGLIGGMLHEKESILGLYGSGGFNMADTQTYYMGVKAMLKPTEKLELTGSYYYGLTPAKRLNSFLRTGNLISEGLSFDARYLLDDKNYMGLLLSSPLRIRDGYANMMLPSGRDYYSDTMYQNHTKLSMKQQAREWDIGVYGMYQLLPNVRAKTQGMIRFNPEHQKNVKPDYQVLFGLDWKWN
ncbi:MAG: hypothetical protein E7014_05880 [Alphaproteobacteria bacterium]|nr:hypothetical protein [Alphaproteobacteria bacterium]